MATTYPISGAQIYIGGTMTLDGSVLAAGDFSSESWTEVKAWESMGEVGDQAEIIRTTFINEGRVNKTKGPRDAGSMQNVFGRLTGDAGQAAMEAAQATNENYAFKIEFDDVPSGGATPTTLYFAALVSSEKRAGGGGSSIDKKMYNLEINSNVVEVAAA